MKKALILLSLLVTLVGCNNGSRLSSDDNKIYYGETPVGTFLPVESDAVAYDDQMEFLDDNTLKITRTFTALQDIDSIRLTLNFRHESECQSAMIPSVSYDGNHWGKGKEPKGFQTDGVWHTYSYRRTPIPGATYSEGKDFAIAMWGTNPTNEAEAFSCSLMPEETEVTHSLILPEEERPFIYSGRDSYKDGFARKLSMRKGETRKMEAYLSVSPKSDNSYPIAAFLDKAWELADKEYAQGIPADKVWEYGIRYVKESLWAEEKEYKGFSIGLVPDGKGGWRQRPFAKYEIGWCGQNASFINSLLTDYLRTGNQESHDKALTALSTWTSDLVQKENGHYTVQYDNVLRGNDKAVSDACNLGTAAYNFFETVGLLEQCKDTDRMAKVKEVALGICDLVKRDQQPSGVYGKGWYADGECYFREGTVGAFMIPAMLRAFKATVDSSYFHSASKAFDYYYGEFEQLGYTTAGALDTWCIDKESSMPLLRSALVLYDTTQEQAYIEKAEKISYYLSTWLWHYKAGYDADEDATRYGYNTFGATSVSTQHHHLDVYALMWVSEWLRLAELSGNDTWREKALAIWTNGCQILSDGTLEINGLIRPVGSQNEAFFECTWGGYPERKRINDWLVAWPGAFRLETMRNISDWGALDNE